MIAIPSLRRLVLASLILLAAGGLGRAVAQEPLANPNPSPAAVDLAKQLLFLKGSPQMFDRMVDNIITQSRDVFIPTNPNLSKPLNEVVAQLRPEFAPKKAELINEVARAYARHFTEAEMKDLIAFYKSPLGQKVLKEEPLAVEDGLKRAQEWTNELSDQVMARLRAEMKKKGYDL